MIRQPKPLLSKDMKMKIYSKAWLYSFSPVQKLISELLTRIYSSASIAANRMLPAVFILRTI
jgi:hypothetical protein